MQICAAFVRDLIQKSKNQLQLRSTQKCTLHFPSRNLDVQVRPFGSPAPSAKSRPSLQNRRRVRMCTFSCEHVSNDCLSGAIQGSLIERFSSKYNHVMSESLIYAFVLMQQEGLSSR